MDGGPVCTLFPLKRVRKSAIPLSFLPKDADWNASALARPFMLPESASSSVFTPSSEVVVAVKVLVGNTPRLGLVEHCAGSIWALIMLDKTVRAKDVRAMPEVQDITTVQHPECAGQSIIDSCSVAPEWKKRVSLRMNPPGSLDLESLIPPPQTDLDSQLATLSHLSPMKKALDVSSILCSKYYETLYVAQTPVSYFAKSNLSRARAKCKEKYPPLDGSPTTRVVYLDKLVKILKSMILDILDLDSKYDTHNFWQAVRSNQFSAYTSDEQKCMKSWFTDLEDRIPNLSLQSDDFKSGIELLKTREIQLQIILLMEILALESERDTKLGKDTASSPQAPKRTRNIGLVRLKKQPKTQEPTSKEPSINLMAIAMFDRLCIRNLSDEKIDHIRSDAHFDTPAQATAAADKTQEFCREAIIPFFNSRLPDLCKTLVQSCRGNSTGHAKRHHSVKTHVPASHPKPEPVKRTDSLASLAEVTKAAKTASFRGGVSALNTKKAVDRRQIEMTFTSSQNEDEELRNAIRNISKPSRLSVSAQHANSLPSTKLILPTRKTASKPERRAIEVESTPIRRKRQLKAGVVSQPKQSSQILIDGEIYSAGEEDEEEGEDVIMETPMKKKSRLESGTNFNDRLNALSSSVPTLSNAEEEEIFSSPMKTPHSNRGVPFPETISSEPRNAVLPLNPIYDQNSPLCLFPDRSPLRQRPVFSPSSNLKFPPTESAKKRKSTQWFDDEFPMTKTQSNHF